MTMSFAVQSQSRLNGGGITLWLRFVPTSEHPQKGLAAILRQKLCASYDAMLHKKQAQKCVSWFWGEIR